MADSVPEEQHHEESETYQDPSGRWQNYYGGAAGSPNTNGPAMGLRIPLEPTASYATSGEADKAAQARSDMYPSVLEGGPVSPAPGTGMIAPTGIPAAQMLSGGTSADLARQAAALAPIPDPKAYQDAQQRYADTVQDYIKTGKGYEESYAAKAKETDLAAQQYEQRARELLPQQPQIQQPPPRSLRAFLSPTANEDPYTTVSKFMQSVSLLATMMGGGRNGARASVSALTGAVEGWTKGDRYRADSEYQTWKDTTEALFRQFDDEMRAYNSIMIAERVPMEQKLRALETTAWQQKNGMAAKTFEVSTAREAFEHLDKMRQQGIGAQMEAAKIQGMYDNAQQKYDLLQQQINQQNDKLSQQMAALASGEKLKWEIAQLQSATKLQAMQAKIDAKSNLRPPSAQDDKAIDQAMDKEGMFAQMDALLQSGKVDLNKIVGGINPWLNSLSQKWGGRGNTPAVGTQADAIDTKKMGRLTPEESEFLGLMHNYASTLLNERSGSAVTGNEFDRYLQFGLDSSLSPATNRTRMLSLRQLNIQTLRNRLARMEATGKNTPDINQLIPRLGAPVTLGAPASATAPAPTEPGKGWGKAELVKQ